LLHVIRFTHEQKFALTFMPPGGPGGTRNRGAYQRYKTRRELQRPPITAPQFRYPERLEVFSGAR
jgi:hypothetical protein